MIRRSSLIVATLLATTLASTAGDDDETRLRPPAERDARASGCVARVIERRSAATADKPAGPGEQRDTARRRAEQLGAAVYSRCGLPR